MFMYIHVHIVLPSRISIAAPTCLATCLPHVGDEMPGWVTGTGGYYACGANVASKARGRERQRGRWENINGGIKWWWQQKMAARSNTVLMDLFALCGGERRNREMVCHCESLYDILSPLCHHSLWLGLTHMRPTLCNDIMIPTLCNKPATCHDSTLTHYFFTMGKFFIIFTHFSHTISCSLKKESFFS